jgi:hypothetical protein
VLQNLVDLAGSIGTLRNDVLTQRVPGNSLDIRCVSRQYKGVSVAHSDYFGL